MLKDVEAGRVVEVAYVRRITFGILRHDDNLARELLLVGNHEAVGARGEGNAIDHRRCARMTELVPNGVLQQPKASLVHQEVTDHLAFGSTETVEDWVL